MEDIPEQKTKVTSYIPRPAHGGITYPDRSSRYYIIGTIFLAGLFGFLDRQIISLLVIPIRTDLHLSNTQVSLLYGFAFVFLFATVGLFIGRMIDRHSRRTILAIGVAVWSLATVGCGLAPNFTWLFIARVMVGSGEACLAPAACSILADCFTPAYRSRALFVYMVGAFVGVGASMLVGGILFEFIGHQHLTVAGLASWRLVFVLIGAPGLMIAILARLMTEPTRKGIVISHGEPAWDRLIPYLARHWPLFAAVYAAQAAMAFWTYGLHAWMPTYLIRRFGLSVAAVGTQMGVLLAAGGIIGALTSVQMCDRWTFGGVPAAKFRITAIGAMAAFPAMVVLPLATSAWQVWTCLAVLVTAAPFSSCTATIMMQDLFPNQLRGQGTSLMLFIISLLGTSAGPLAIGMLIDAGGDNPGQIVKAITFASLPALLLVVVLWKFSVRRYDTVRLPILEADTSTN